MRARTFLVTTSSLAAGLLTITPVLAHHPDASAGGGSGPIATISASTLEAGQSSIGFVEQYIKVRGFDFNSLGANQHAHTMKYINSAAAAFAYGVTNDITVSVRLPYVT